MSDKTLIKKGISGMAWMTGSTIMAYIIQLIITAILARYLSPSDYGEVAAINILIGLAEIFWMLGIGPAIVQKQNLTNEDIYTGNTINIIFGSTIYIIIYIFADVLCKLFNIESSFMLRIFSLVFIMNSISGVSKSLVQKKCDYKNMAAIKIVGIVIYGVTAMIFVFNGINVWALVLGTIAQTLYTTIAYFIVAPIRLKFMIKKESAKALMYFGGGFTIARIFNYIANNGDTYCVNKILDKTALGFYSKAYQLLMYPTSLIGDSLDQVCFPLLSKKQDDTEWLHKVFLGCTIVVFSVSIPISIFCYSCADGIVNFIYGSKWNNTVMPFKIFISGLFFRIGYKISDSLVRALGKVYKRSFYQIIYAALIVIGSITGSFKGISGVAIGVTIAFTVNYILMTNLSLKLLNATWRNLIKNLIFPSVCGILCTICIFFLKMLTSGINQIIEMIVIGFASVVFYTIPFVIFKKDSVNYVINLLKTTLINRRQVK